MKLSDRVLGIWDGYTKKQKLLMEVKMRQAQSHYNWFVYFENNNFFSFSELLLTKAIIFRHLKWRVVDHWQRLHTILRIEKETDERRQRWRMKIWELLPDYTPTDEQ